MGDSKRGAHVYNYIVWSIDMRDHYMLMGSVAASAVLPRGRGQWMAFTDFNRLQLSTAMNALIISL